MRMYSDSINVFIIDRFLSWMYKIIEIEKKGKKNQGYIVDDLVARTSIDREVIFSLIRASS